MLFYLKCDVLCDDDKTNAVFFLMHMHTIPANLQAIPSRHFCLQMHVMHLKNEVLSPKERPKNIPPQEMSAQGALGGFSFNTTVKSPCR